MDLTREDFEKITRLAKMKLSPEEKNQLFNNLDLIVANIQLIDFETAAGSVGIPILRPSAPPTEEDKA